MQSQPEEGGRSMPKKSVIQASLNRPKAKEYDALMHDTMRILRSLAILAIVFFVIYIFVEY